MKTLLLGVLTVLIAIGVMIAQAPINPIGTSGGSSGGGATIPSTTNLINGDGTGNGADSGIAPANVAELNAHNVYTATNAASTSVAQFTGALTTGLTGTTAFPYFFINQGAAATTWSTSGTLVGINAPSGFAGNFLDFRTNGAASTFSVSSAGNILTGGSISLGGSSPISFVNRAKMFSTSDGVFLYQNNAGTSFSRIQFGGTTSSFPALNINGAGLEAKLADNSARTTFAALSFNSPLTTPASSSATCTAGDMVSDANFIYICTATNTWKRAAIVTF